ncbi:MAG: VOC family protein [Myxococcota bacterium]
MSTISYIEMGSGNASLSSSFFERLFDWRFHAMDGSEGGGWFETSSIRVGLHGRDHEFGIVPYFRVQSIEVAVADVRRLGGQADDHIANEPGFGRFCNCKDPQGMRFGLHEPPT